MSGSHDMVVDVGFMSIEVMCNEFTKKIREERENDCWLKLTVKWDGEGRGKNTALENNLAFPQNVKHRVIP